MNRAEFAALVEEWSKDPEYMKKVEAMLKGKEPKSKKKAKE